MTLRTQIEAILKQEPDQVDRFDYDDPDQLAAATSCPNNHHGARKAGE